jgi:glycerophosphoryl diester phosphodiesterase
MTQPLAGQWPLPRVIAHRGASAVAPENTLAAIALAAELGARAVELDVTLTRDGVPVILHDDTLERTTDGVGPVAAVPYERLAQLDAGSWFSREFDGEKVPTLAEAAALIRARGMAFNLEIKPSPGREPETAERALAVLAAVWPDDAPLLVSSASPAALAVARDGAPHWPRGLIVDRVPRDWRARLAAHGCVSLHCNASAVTPALVQEAHAAGYRVLAWTVNRAGRARRLFADGADGIFTDQVAAMVASFAD